MAKGNGQSCEGWGKVGGGEGKGGKVVSCHNVDRFSWLNKGEKRRVFISWVAAVGKSQALESQPPISINCRFWQWWSFTEIKKDIYICIWCVAGYSWNLPEWWTFSVKLGDGVEVGIGLTRWNLQLPRGGICIQYSPSYIFEGYDGSITTNTRYHMHGMLEMFTYLNLPILFGIILLCRIFKIGGYMYLVVHCSKKNMKCLVTGYVKKIQ